MFLAAGCKRSQSPQLRVDPKIRFELLTANAKAPSGFSLERTKLGLSTFSGGEELRFFLQSGDVRTYHVRMAHNLTMKRSGVTELKTRILQDVRMRVKNLRVDKGVARQRLRLSGARLLAEPSQGDIGKKLEDMLNDASLTYTLDRHGTIADVKSGPQVARELKNFMATFRQVLLQASPTFPKRVVRAADRWADQQQHRLVLPSGASIDVSTEREFEILGERKCTPKEAKISCILLSQTFRVTIKGTVQQLGVSAPVTGTGTGVGAILFDRERGTLRRVELASRVTNRLTLSSGNTKRPVEQKIDLRYSLVETR